MRHFAGIILALAASAALFFGGGWGVSQFSALAGSNGLWVSNALTNSRGLLAVVVVLGTGLLLGILLAGSRVSPLATGLPGLVLLAWTALVVTGNAHALSLVPLQGSRYAAGFTFLLVRGVLALVGTAMVVPLLMPSRWQRRYRAADEYRTDRIDLPTAYGMAP
ncbi:MAG TPA: hypothetical protein VNF47_15855 [Streptosporangiaceae bacterium]|nr:hypothetical protein [Streptosporangiaceae bacterium]